MLASENNAVHILEALESEVAHIPGGRDREGRPLIVVHVPPGEPKPSIKSNLESVIEYFLSIFSGETNEIGICLLIDIRVTTWKIARTYIRLLTVLIDGSETTSIIAIKPDGFWEKRVDHCTKVHKKGEPLYIPLNRLVFYVENSQLPYSLGGNKPYNHLQWIKNRLRIEEFMKESLELITKMTTLQERLRNSGDFWPREFKQNIDFYMETSTKLTNMANYVLSSGRKLVSDMSRETSQDILDTMQKIHKMLDAMQLKQVEIENAWSEMQRNLDTITEIEILEKGVSRVTNWILGPADSMLNCSYQIGFDVTSSEKLRREHENLELECRETYGQYAELIHKIDNLPNNRLSEDLKSQKEFMDFVCRSFATRLERRRNVLITSQRFFRLVSEYFDKTSEVFDKLIMGNRTNNFVIAETKLYKLERSQNMLDALERELVKEGEKLTDILSMPVKDALCRDVDIDYGEDIVNVRDILDATNARKNIFNDSVELQKLTLKQITLINSYESDAAQAFKWLNDLFDTLLDNHVEIGCNVAEIQTQKEEHQSFQETAKSTFEYGCQLINGARVLRLSCKLPLDNNLGLSYMLRKAWKQLYTVGQEQLTRLRVCAVFHRSVEDHCDSLKTLIEIVVSVLSKRKSRYESELQSDIEDSTRAEIRDVLVKREKLLPEVGRMVRLGRLLRTRLKEPLNHKRMTDIATDTSAGNLSAIESISAKLLEVTRLAEKLDSKLFEAGARERSKTVSIAETTADAKQKEETDGTNLRISSPSEFKTSNEDNEVVNAKSDANSVIEDSNTEEYVTATECSTTPMTRSRSESLLTSSEYEDAIGIPASPWHNFESQMSRSTDCLSELKIENEIKGNTITLRDTNEPKMVNHDDRNYEDETSNCTMLKRSLEDTRGNVLTEVTETTTLRVSHNTHLGVASFNVTANRLSKSLDNIDQKELDDTNLVINEKDKIHKWISDKEKGKIENTTKLNNSSLNDHILNSDLKSPWLISREERSLHSTFKDSSNSTSSVFNKYLRTNLREIRTPPPIEEEQLNFAEEYPEEEDPLLLSRSEYIVSNQEVSEQNKAD